MLALLLMELRTLQQLLQALPWSQLLQHPQYSYKLVRMLLLRSSQLNTQGHHLLTTSTSSSHRRLLKCPSGARQNHRRPFNQTRPRPPIFPRFRSKLKSSQRPQMWTFNHRCIKWLPFCYKRHIKEFIFVSIVWANVYIYNSKDQRMQMFLLNIILGILVFLAYPLLCVTMFIRKTYEQWNSIM